LKNFTIKASDYWLSSYSALNIRLKRGYLTLYMQYSYSENTENAFIKPIIILIFNNLS